MNINLPDEEIMGTEKSFLKRRENGLMLSDNDIEILERNGINYLEATNLESLIFMIEEALSEEEYFKGNDNILPKGFIFPINVKYINFNLDMNYINENMELNNIKNNNHINKNRKAYAKTSQSKRDSKLIKLLNNNQNQDKENHKLNNDIKSKRTNSINRAKLKTKTDIKPKINKNHHPLNENNKICK